MTAVVRRLALVAIGLLALAVGSCVLPSSRAPLVAGPPDCAFEPVESSPGAARSDVSATALSAAPDPFSPNGDGTNDDTELATTVSVDALPGSPSSRHAFFLRARFEIAGGDTCEVRTEIDIDLPISAVGAHMVVARWDGRLATGAIVPDGTYAVRAVVELVRRHVRNGREDVLNRVASPVGAVTVDGAAPSVVFFNPSVPTPLVAVADLGDVFAPRGSGTPFRFAGAIEADGDLVEATLTVGATIITVGEGPFEETLPIAATGPSDSWRTSVTLSATDLAGNVATTSYALVVLPTVVEGTVALRCNPDARQHEVERTLAEIGGRTIWRDALTRYFVIELPAGEDGVTRAGEVGARPGVAYALPVLPSRTECFATPVDDSFFGRADSWNLSNDSSYRYFAPWACDATSPCPVPSLLCTATTAGDQCRCTTTANCPFGYFCLPFDRDPTVSVCARRGRDRADLGWEDALTTITGLCGPGEPDPTITVAVIDAGIFNFENDELGPQVFTSSVECCGACSARSPARSSVPCAGARRRRSASRA